jgi:phage-related protein
MAGTVSELRARFTAQISNFRSTISGVREEISQIGRDTTRSTGIANTALNGLLSSLRNLRGALDSAGNRSSSAFNPLNLALGRVEQDLQDIGRISSTSLGLLTNATEHASREMRELGQSGEDLSLLERAINDVERELRDLDNSNLNHLTRSAQLAENEIEDIGQAANESESKFSRLNQKLAGFAGAYLGFEALKNTVSVLGESFIGANADMETYENTLTTVLKSNERAVDMLAWAEKFAATTPFEIPEIVEATTALETYGLSAKDTLGTIGDMAGVTGKPLMQAVEAIADAQTGELERLKEFGITKQMLIDKSAELGKSEIVNAKGQITDMEGLNEALFALMRDRYEGGMETASKSFKGLVSNARDSIGTIGRELGKPVFEGFKKNLQSVVPVLGSVTQLVRGDTKGAMDTLTESFGEEKANKIISFFQGVKNGFKELADFIKSFSPAIENLKVTFQNLAPVFTFAGGAIAVAFRAIAVIIPPLIEGITKVGAIITGWDGFIPILSGIAAGLLAYKTYMLALQVPTLLQTAKTKALALATKILNKTMATNPIGLIIALLIGLGVALVTAYKKSETFRNIVNGAWETIKNGAKAVLDWFTINIPIWIDNIVQAWESFKGGIVAIWNWLKGFFSKWGVEILAVIAPFIGIPLLIAKNWETIQTFLVNLWNSIISVVMPIIDKFVSVAKQLFTNFVNNTKGIVTPIKDFFVNTWQNIKLLVLSIVGVFLNLITGNFEDLKISLLGIWTALKNQIVNIVKTFKDVALALFKLFWNGVTTGFNALKSGIVKIVTTIKTTAVNLFNGLKSGVVNTVNNLKNGAVNAFNSLKNGAVNSVKALKNGTVNAIKSAKTIFSNTVNGIKDGVKNGFTTAKNTAINAVNGMRTSISNGINRIKGFFTGMKSSVISTVKSINLKSIGKNIVQGLINGITGMIGKVADTVKNLANTVTSKIKGILDIHSPSRVFRSFGNFIGEGLAIGIDKSRKMVAAASQMLAESAMIEPDTNGIGDLTGETIGDQINLDHPDNEGGGGTHTTNYDAPLMNVENMYVNDKDDAREVSNGLYRLQQDHDRARGKKTS